MRGGISEGQSAPATAHPGRNTFRERAHDEGMACLAGENDEKPAYGRLPGHPVTLPDTGRNAESQSDSARHLRVCLPPGWAGGNPVEGTFAPAVIEKKIPVLMPEECGRLIRTAQKEYDGACLPAAVLMLYAGVRPQEVRRLRFRHLRLENGELIIPSTHSKTGGSRLVTLQPVALRFLRSFRRVPPDTFICPKGWERKWREVRVRAGWNKNHPWAQDILRHTFASYHAAAFRDYTALQWEMGHRDGRQLRTRYMNMDSIGRKHAALFWKGRERQYERRSLNINQNGFFG